MLEQFALTPYTFLMIEDGLVAAEYEAEGVFKQRTGRVSDRHDSNDVSSTLHIFHEGFVDEVGGYMGLTGHGICRGDNTYQIEGVTHGEDLVDTGQSEFYRLTLTKKDTQWRHDLPLA